MRLLLDTHALLWWWGNDPQLSGTARAAIADESHEVFVSAASAWGIATKQRIGKLPPWPMPTGGFNELVMADGFVNRSVPGSPRSGVKSLISLRLEVRQVRRKSQVHVSADRGRRFSLIVDDGGGAQVNFGDRGHSSLRWAEGESGET